MLWLLLELQYPSQLSKGLHGGAPCPIPTLQRRWSHCVHTPVQDEPWPQKTEGSMTRVQDDETPPPPQGMHLWA